MKKFLLPFQNVVRADLFSGSLAVWNALGFRIHFARPPIPSPDCEAIAGEDRIPFELFQEYTALTTFYLPAGRQVGVSQYLEVKVQPTMLPAYLKLKNLSFKMKGFLILCGHLGSI